MKLIELIKNKRFQAAAILIIAAVSFLILFFYDPALYTYYPPCYLYAITGKLCPGCGGMRGFHQLVHGKIADAWKFNLLLFIILPVIFYYLLSQLRYLITKKYFPIISYPNFFNFLIPAVILAYWILRNVL